MLWRSAGVSPVQGLPWPRVQLGGHREQVRGGVNGQVGTFREVLAELIGDLLRAGQSVPSIAARLRRSPSTVSRDRRNNSEAGNYRPFTAHRKALARRPRPMPGKLAHDKPLRDFVQAKLTLRW